MSTTQLDGQLELAARLLAYLRDQLHDPTIEYSALPTQLQGGFETATYRFGLAGVQEALDKPLVLRLYPASRGPQAAVWESSVQNALAGEGYPVARAHLVCTDKSVLGGAFFIMDLLPGRQMIEAPLESIPGMLGRAHAALHRIDPGAWIRSLREQGIDERQVRLDSRYAGLQDVARELPWTGDGIDWLLAHRPPEPERLVICHGDFHPLNILVQDGQVTGVLDWPGFLVADPALDVANTLLLMTVPFRHLAPALLGPDVASVDWEMGARLYLAAYRAELPLDGTHLDTYRVWRSIDALVEGTQGHQVWGHPAIAQDLVEWVRQVTGIRIVVPER